MKKLIYLIVLALILGLVLTGCSLLSNISQVPTTDQSDFTYLTKGVPSGLVGLWHFDGDALDSSGHGNNGTVNGAIIWDDGKFGDALSFYGSDDYVDLGNNVFFNADLATYTFEAWIKIASLDGVERRIFDDEGGLRPDLSSTNSLRAVHYDGAVRIVEWANTPSVDTWYHVVQSYDGSYLRLYINGSEVGTRVSCSAWTPDSHDRAVRIGASWHPTPERHWKGLIDEVRIWDVALDEDAIRQSYELGNATAIDRVVQLSHQVLVGGEVVCFTSAFYLERQIENTLKTVDIYIMSASGGRAIEEIGFRGATPAKTEGSMIPDNTPIPCSGTQGTAEVTNGPAVGKKDKTSTSIHLYAELDVGDPDPERLGVNAQYLPWD